MRNTVPSRVATLTSRSTTMPAGGSVTVTGGLAMARIRF
jgi:hypothetical protein